ncbi:DUF6233 domain-containing protein [Streptomyces sp. NPDC046977]|uniref:DUF6233 domain-containing protein n=1 Tax=Streptomyces sp. NPDC046977 TaxID=3154703 RepID=UPI0033C3EAD6
MIELPSDLERLQVLRTYLRLQLAAVDAEIAKAQRGPERRPAPRPAPRPARQPAVQPGTLAERTDRAGAVRPSGMPNAKGLRWRLQSVPDPSGSGYGRGVLHRGDCEVRGGGWLSRKELELALGMEDVTPCQRCRPDRR